MDNEQTNVRGWPIGDRWTARSAGAASTRQLARNRGLVWVRAITLGAGAAGALGATAIAVTLPGSTTTAAAHGGTVARTPQTPSVGDHNAAAGDNGQPAAPQRQPAAPQQQLQPAAPPSNTNNPPVATSGGS